jgi:hypothetical protein
MLQTEFEFTLPRGYVDAQGNLQRHGTMRLATAMDEIEPLQDVRVRANEAYLSILLLSRVITSLGDIRQIEPVLVEKLFSADLAYLQHLYIQINDGGSSLIQTQCPQCGTAFVLDLAGESNSG